MEVVICPRLKPVARIDLDGLRQVLEAFLGPAHDRVEKGQAIVGVVCLGVTRQALHKRIKAGTALGMMDGEELVLPKLQFVSSGEKVRLVKGLGEVISLFERSGGWSALQFLVEKDPNLAAAPIEALNAGKVEAVVAAARAYLSLDEG